MRSTLLNLYQLNKADKQDEAYPPQLAIATIMLHNKLPQISMA